MQHQNWSCLRCHNTEYDVDEIRSSGRISRFFDVQNKKFAAVVCQRCGFTELYRGKSSTLGNVFDFFMQG